MHGVYLRSIERVELQYNGRMNQTEQHGSPTFLMKPPGFRRSWRFHFESDPDQ